MEENWELVRRTVGRDMTEDEFERFMYLCETTRLDPLLGQVIVMTRRSKDRETGQWTERHEAMIPRDGYRIIAHRTGALDGIVVKPQFGEKGDLLGASATVYRKDARHPFAAEVYLREYKEDNQMWRSKPITMIGKVAEAHALRMAFPDLNVGAYTPEEMGLAESEEELDDWHPETQAHEAPPTLSEEPDKGGSSEANKPKPERPYDPATLRDGLRAQIAKLNSMVRSRPTTAQLQLLRYAIELATGGANNEAKAQNRHLVLDYLLGKTSSKDINLAECKAMLDIWLKPEKDEDEQYSIEPDYAPIEARAIIQLAQIEAGQMTLADSLLDPEDQPEPDPHGE